jgi:SOS-response transcriptional repressor LexA
MPKNLMAAFIIQGDNNDLHQLVKIAQNIELQHLDFNLRQIKNKFKTKLQTSISIKLTPRQQDIFNWAKEYYKRTGQWPSQKQAAQEKNVDSSIISKDFKKFRELKLLPPTDPKLQKTIDLRNKARQTKKNSSTELSSKEQAFLDWIKEHYKRTGQWPSQKQAAQEKKIGTNAVVLYLRKLRKLGYLPPRNPENRLNQDILIRTLDQIISFYHLNLTDEEQSKIVDNLSIIKIKSLMAAFIIQGNSNDLYQLIKIAQNIEMQHLDLVSLQVTKKFEKKLKSNKKQT